jgi:hypothetical protein
MEAKVDVRKLQLLNDRINQTIEALHQVRLSVHGLTHSAQGQMGQMGQQYGMQGLTGGIGSQMGGMPYGQQFGNVGFGGGQMGLPYGQQFGNVGFGQMGAGLQHTSPLSQIGSLGNVPPWALQGVFGGQSQMGAQGVYGQQQTPWATPFQSQMGWTGGLGHTSQIEDVERRVAEVKASDPSRLAQTFPYVFSI